MLCDGRWHRLVARKSKHTLSLSVDGRSDSIANPYPQSTSAETNNPVFVGGYPGELYTRTRLCKILWKTPP